MKIAVIGTGYVGLVTGTCLAESGNDVVGIDNNAAQDRDAASRQAPDLRAGLARTGAAQPAKAGSSFTTDLAEAHRASAELIFIAVGTPQSARRRRRPRAASGPSPTRSPTLKAIRTAAPGKIVVIKSTVPVGTNAELAERLAKAGCPATSTSPATPSSSRKGRRSTTS